MLYPKFNGECISRDGGETTTATATTTAGFINKVATGKFGTEHSAEVITELTEYHSKEGILEKLFY
jgi:hypothetical protein